MVVLGRDKRERKNWPREWKKVDGGEI